MESLMQDERLKEPQHSGPVAPFQSVNLFLCTHVVRDKIPALCIITRVLL